MTQEELLDLQKETVESIKEYLENLIPSMNNVVVELREDMKEDTWEYLRMILDGFNWVVKAFNGVVSIIDSDASRFDIKAIDAAVGKLSDAYTAKDPAAIADSLEKDIVPFLEKVKEVNI